MHVLLFCDIYQSSKPHSFLHIFLIMARMTDCVPHMTHWGGRWRGCHCGTLGQRQKCHSRDGVWYQHLCIHISMTHWRGSCCRALQISIKTACQQGRSTPARHRRHHLDGYVHTGTYRCRCSCRDLHWSIKTNCENRLEYKLVRAACTLRVGTIYHTSNRATHWCWCSCRALQSRTKAAVFSTDGSHTNEYQLTGTY